MGWGFGYPPPEELDAAIIFAPVGALVPTALRAIRPGGTVVCGGIHMSDIPSFPYDILWREKRLVSVANLTRRDAEEFLTWRRRSRSGSRPSFSRWSRRIRPWNICGMAS